MIIDLHCHTNCSDGVLTPAELIDLAIENKLDILAITDHDGVDAYNYIDNNKDKIPKSLKIINGIEFSTAWSGIGIHIVGLNFDINHPSIVSGVSFQKQARIDRTKKIIQRLSKQNINIDYEELLEQTGHDNIGRPHLAKYLIDKNYVTSFDRAFKKHLGAGKAGDVKQCWAEIEQIISWINDAGGIAVIAHPDKYKMTRMKLHHFIDCFVEMGGKGIEIISGHQLPEVTEKYIKLANDKGLLASIGSDFHRHAKFQSSLGLNGIMEKVNLPDSVTPVWEMF